MNSKYDDQAPNQRAAIRERLNRVNKVLNESEVMIKRSPLLPREPISCRPPGFLPLDLHHGSIAKAHVEHNELER